MTVVRIQKIIWSEFTVGHIKKHEVTVEEAELVIKSDALSLEGHNGKRILVNKVNSRIIAVIVKMIGNKLYVATARDASDKERKDFYEYKKIKTGT